MSDAGSIEPSSAASPEAATPEVIPSLQCPGCDATLLKVSVAPGGTVRCLHCGARFLAGSPTANAGPAADELPVRALGREPRSPGYWLLRIPAVVLGVGGTGVTLFVAWSLMWRLLHFQSVALEDGLAYLYVPLLMLAGLLGISLTRSLARIDTGLMRLAWSCGRIHEPLPAPPGSSLPYILPLALAGGLAPVCAFGFSSGLPGQQKTEMLVAAICGALVFYCGFAAEDLRQFSWRQRTFAERLAGLRWREPPATPLATWPFVAGFAMLSALWAWCFEDSYGAYYRYNRDNDCILFVIGCLIAGAFALTSYFILHAWEGACDGWLAAAATHPAATHGGAKPYLQYNRDELPAVTRWLVRAPLLWLCYGIVWFFMVLISDRGPPQFWPVVLLIGAFSGAAVGFSLLLKRVANWSAAVVYVCQRVAQAPSGKEAPLTGIQSWLIRITFGLATVQAIYFSVVLFCSSTRFGVRWQALFAIPLALGLCHYPTLWVAAMVREFARVERSLARNDE